MTFKKLMPLTQSLPSRLRDAGLPGGDGAGLGDNAGPDGDGPERGPNTLQGSRCTTSPDLVHNTPRAQT